MKYNRDRKDVIIMMKNILLAHSALYPQMHIEDYMKLIHQSVYGPAHISEQPNREQLLSFLRHEIMNSKTYLETPMIEMIGNDYYRVSIEAVKHGLITDIQLIDAFYQSILHSPKKDAFTDHVMSVELKQFQILVENRSIQLDVAKTKEMIVWYQKQGYPPIHHSENYRLFYHPHYRLIHQKYIPESMK